VCRHDLGRAGHGLESKPSESLDPEESTQTGPGRCENLAQKCSWTSGSAADTGMSASGPPSALPLQDNRGSSMGWMSWPSTEPYGWCHGPDGLQVLHGALNLRGRGPMTLIHMNHVEHAHHVETCTYCVYTCTYTVHGYHILYAYTTMVYATAYCTAFAIAMYYAIVQESTIVYKEGYTSYIPPKNGCWDSDNWLKHVCTLHVYTCTYTIHCSSSL
jgi:hypothetical protein